MIFIYIRENVYKIQNLFSFVRNMKKMVIVYNVNLVIMLILGLVRVIQVLMDNAIFTRRRIMNVQFVDLGIFWKMGFAKNV